MSGSLITWEKLASASICIIQFLLEHYQVARSTKAATCMIPSPASKPHISSVGAWVIGFGDQSEPDLITREGRSRRAGGGQSPRRGLQTPLLHGYGVTVGLSGFRLVASKQTGPTSQWAMGEFRMLELGKTMVGFGLGQRHMCAAHFKQAH